MDMCWRCWVCAPSTRDRQESSAKALLREPDSVPRAGLGAGTSYAVAPFIALNAVQLARASLCPSSEQVARA